MQPVTAKAKMLLNIKGNPQYYILLEDVNGETYPINVGKKTFETCATMQETEKKPKELPNKAT